MWSSPKAVPQAATFWRRDCFDRYGLFREDMHYVFDTEFMLRLAYAGELPALIDQELSVRVVHEAAKSWDRTPWETEQRRFPRLFAGRLNTRERVGVRLGQAAIRLGLYS